MYIRSLSWYPIRCGSFSSWGIHIYALLLALILYHSFNQKTFIVGSLIIYVSAIVFFLGNQQKVCHMVKGGVTTGDLVKDQLPYYTIHYILTTHYNMPHKISQVT